VALRRLQQVAGPQHVGVVDGALVRLVAVQRRDEGGGVIDAVAASDGAIEALGLSQIAGYLLDGQASQARVVAVWADQDPQVLSVGEQAMQQVAAKVPGRASKKDLAHVLCRYSVSI
jgi:hypothetical protein